CVRGEGVWSASFDSW
nr:immunoglobulin heavy chain junction region [Macaca mulatta]